MSQANFATIQPGHVYRSVLDRDPAKKLDIYPGTLNPVLVEEILPGDTINLQLHAFGRWLTLINPIMDDMIIDLQAFFVPDRLVWENFERFIGTAAPGDAEELLIPWIYGTQGDGGTSYLITKYSLADYLGLPADPNPEVGSGGVYIDSQSYFFSSLVFRGIRRIWNEWYRAEYIQDEIDVPLDDGPDLYEEINTIPPRNRRHDYFTSLLATPQQGPDVVLPLGDTAPVFGWDGRSEVYGNGPLALTDLANGGDIDFFLAGRFPNVGNQARLFQAPGIATSIPHVGDTGDPMFPSGEEPARDVYMGVTGQATQSGLAAVADVDGLYADLTGATAASINTIRQAAILQQYYEKVERGGSRYVEILRNVWKVISPDFRLQRTEFLGSSMSRFSIHQIAQTAPTESSPLASLAATASMTAHLSVHKSFVEHGHLIVLGSARAPLTYQNGVHRMWTRRTKFDRFIPGFEGLGEQPVTNMELVFTGDPATDYGILGYQERWSEYKYSQPQLVGDFRCSRSDPAYVGLNSWHMGLFFQSPVTLDVLVAEDVPWQRVSSNTTKPPLMLDVKGALRHVRPMPVKSIPGIDRF